MSCWYGIFIFTELYVVLLRSSNKWALAQIQAGVRLQNLIASPQQFHTNREKSSEWVRSAFEGRAVGMIIELLTVYLLVDSMHIFSAEFSAP